MLVILLENPPDFYEVCTMSVTEAHSITPPTAVYKAWGLLILLALIWGSSFALIKQSLTVFHPMQVASIRVLAASSVLLVIAFFAFAKISRKKWGLAFISGLLGVFIPSFLFPYAQTKLSPAVTGILNALTPIFTLLIAVLFFQQKAQPIKWLGMLIGFFGSALLTLASSGSGKFEFTWYPLLIMLATICYALNGNISKTYMQGISSVYLTAMSQAFIAPFSLVVLLNSNIGAQWNAPEASKIIEISWLAGTQLEARWFALICIVGLGIFGTAIAMIIFNKLVQIASVIFASAVTYLIPLVALGWEMLDGKFLTSTQMVCMLLIMMGVYLANSKVKQATCLPKIEN